MRTNEPKTPLLALLRMLDADQRLQLAADAEVRLDYLYKLAGCDRKRCNADMASRIEAATRKMATRTARTKVPTKVITVAELGTMCQCVE